MTERWLPVADFEGTYEVSDAGKIRSLDRIITCPSRWSDVSTRIQKGKILQPGTKPGGYLFVGLYNGNGSVKFFMTHRLVAGAFIGPCPQGMEVAHKDGDKKNCTLSNLRYDTPKGNHADKKLHGTQPCGSNNASSKLTDAQVLEIRRRANTSSQKALSREFGVGPVQISRIIRRERWAHLNG